MKASKQIEQLQQQIAEVHEESLRMIQELKFKNTVDEDIRRVNEAGKKLYPEKYETRVIDVYKNAETRNN